jgi:hypothetical protein
MAQSGAPGDHAADGSGVLKKHGKRLGEVGKPSSYDHFMEEK